MYVAIPKELDDLEPRVAATPSSIKQLIKSGLNIYVESGAGLDSFISDDDYKNSGATIVSSSEDLLNNADITLKVLPPLEEEIKLLKEKSIFISLCQTTRELETVHLFQKKGLQLFQCI